MARKKKIQSKNPVIFNEKPENIEGLKKLRIGMEVMYSTPTLFDKCTVESIDKENNTAKLSNGVVVSLGILPNNNLLRLGNSTENTIIKLWDEECELQKKYFLSKRAIREFGDTIKNLSDSFLKNKSNVIMLSNKLNRLKKKFNL